MKSHPASAFLHILFKGFSLSGTIWPGVKENHNLVLGKEFFIQIVPVIRGIISEMIGSRHFWKPSIGFMNKTNMCQVCPACKKSNYPEILFSLGLRGQR